MKARTCTFFWIVLCGLPGPVLLQNRLSVPRLAEPLQFDGRVNEACWDTIAPLPLFTHGPTFGEAPSERSDIFLAYDDQYLYLAGRLYVSRPEYIRGTTYKRDALDPTTDNFGLLIDSYNDKENALAFFTNSVAMRWDGTIFNDAQAPPGEFPVSVDWNAFWDVRTDVTDSVWQAEMRIPFQTLRFQERAGQVIMGVSVLRWMAAKNESDIFPNIPPNWGMFSSWKPSRMQEIVLQGIRPRKPVYLTPYLLAGWQENAELDKDGLGYHADQKPKVELGGDLKYGLTSNLTLDLTVNTDFAQVEADDQQVNLTRFSLFFPEKRQFFLERASVFDFNFDGFNRLFYSRRIGLNEEEPVRIYGGARLVGRIGNHDLGLLNMQTAKSDSLNAENFTVLRTRHRVFNANSYVGGMFTNRMDFQGRFQSAYGLDGLIRVAGNDYLNVKWAQTFTDTADNRVLSLDPTRLYLNWERRRFDGFAYNLTFSYAGRDYLPGAGFELRENYRSLQTRWQYGWNFGNESPLVRLQVYADGLGVQKNDSGIIESTVVKPGFLLESKNAWMADLHLLYDHEYVSEEFELTEEVIVPVGTYDFWQVEGFVQTPFTRLLNANINYAAGSFFDGRLLSVGIMPFYKLSSHLEFSGFYQFNRLSFPDRNQLANTHLGRIKVQYFLNTKFSAAAFLQYNSQERVFTSNIRVRFNPREGNDLYFVFNDLLNSRRNRETPRLPLHDNRAVVVKFTYTFQG